MASRRFVFVLEESDVNDRAIERLQKRMNAKFRAILFACKLCGEYRTGEVNNPGSHSIQNLTCANASEKVTCKMPVKSETRMQLQNFIPGSLVLAPLRTGEERLWPGIIEDPPNGEDLFVTSGLNPNKPAKQFFFVTFIFPESDNRPWVGCFVPAKDVKPFEITTPPQNATEAYALSLNRANEAVHDSPRECLRKFSFAAHVARRRGILLSESPSKSPMNFNRKRLASTHLDSDQDENPGKRIKLASDEIPEERIRLAASNEPPEKRIRPPSDEQPRVRFRLPSDETPEKRIRRASDEPPGKRIRLPSDEIPEKNIRLPSDERPGKRIRLPSDEIQRDELERSKGLEPSGITPQRRMKMCQKGAWIITKAATESDSD